jgi:DNA-directed RNA polymerase specialized sigma subunit
MSKQYIKNKELYDEIMLCKQNDELSNAAAEMFILLAKRTIKKFKFYNPMDKDDCMQTGLEILFKNWRQFDETKYDNAFAYYTEIFKRGTTKGLHDLYKRKGDPDKKFKTLSIDGANEGDGMFNF